MAEAEIDFDCSDDGEEVEEGAAWLATFGDLMSLLLTFFVLLLSFAEMDIVKFKDAMGSMQDAFGVTQAGTSPGNVAPSALIDLGHEKKDRLFEDPVSMNFRSTASKRSSSLDTRKSENEDLLKRVNKSIASNGLENSVVVELTGRGVVVRVRGQLFFSSGSAILKDEAHPLLDDIIGIVEDFPYRMSVEGHTDNQPINTARFRSNWELSTARAISALRYIIDTERIEINRLGAAGYSDVKPITENNTKTGRAQNRRVEFIFFKE